MNIWWWAQPHICRRILLFQKQRKANLFWQQNWLSEVTICGQPVLNLYGFADGLSVSFVRGGRDHGSKHPDHRNSQQISPMLNICFPRAEWAHANDDDDLISGNFDLLKLVLSLVLCLCILSFLTVRTSLDTGSGCFVFCRFLRPLTFSISHSPAGCCWAGK